MFRVCPGEERRGEKRRGEERRLIMCDRKRSSKKEEEKGGESSDTDRDFLLSFFMISFFIYLLRIWWNGNRKIIATEISKTAMLRIIECFSFIYYVFPDFHFLLYSILKQQFHSPVTFLSFRIQIFPLW